MRDTDSANGDKPGWAVLDFSRLREMPEVVFGFLYALAALVSIYVLATAVLLVFRTFQPVWTLETLKSEDLRNLLIAIGAVIAAPFAIWRIIISHWQATAAQDQAKIARENHFTSLFTKAVEQLGAMREIKAIRERPTHNDEEFGIGQTYATVTKTVPNAEVRLGAIYALERIAQDSKRDHWPIMETLCAYVRTNAREPSPISHIARNILARPIWSRKSIEQLAASEGINRALSVDIQAALSVIGRRPSDRRMHEAILRETATNRDAYCLNLARTNLQTAYLEGLSLQESRLDGSNLAFARLGGADLEHATFHDANLEGADLSRANLRHARFHKAHLEGARLYRANLTSAWLEEASLQATSFVAAFLEDAWLHKAELIGASLDRAVLKNAGLIQANLEFASMDRATLHGADLHEAILTDAGLFGADLSKTSGLQQSQIDSAFGDATTKLPPGFGQPRHWARENSTTQHREEYRNEWRKKRRDRFATIDRDTVINPSQ